ncbi:hypothetical protein WV34_11385 [Bacillus amyloliquefaciens]|nr:hypothetical protein WV34_11385 [Bacillus amyloliquefaciens]
MLFSFCLTAVLAADSLFYFRKTAADMPNAHQGKTKLVLTEIKDYRTRHGLLLILDFQSAGLSSAEKM